ncbi:MAG: penicillin acylase family protein [Phycisphaerales bacterium]
MRRPFFRWIVVPCLVLIALLLVALAALFATLHGSLPVRGGERTLAGLSDEVRVERDALGIPVIRAATYADAVRAQGYVHAQERYFQMDLSRRFAAGRLAEVLGERLSDQDASQRLYGMQRVARAVLERMPEERRALLEAYASGVNAGLDDLATRPPEYFALMVAPEPWRPSDCVLCAMAMHQNLAFGERSERMVAMLRDTLPADIAAFLTPRFTLWDAPLFDEPAPELVPMPTSAVPSVASGETVASAIVDVPEYGSNGWAVGGTNTADGRAILANDMHLGLIVPNTWHRVELRTEGRVIAGVSLPGVPGIVVGSNGDVAWGFTNSMGDYQDLVRLVPAPGPGDSYMTPDGPEAYTSREETIRIKGGETRVLSVRETRWGPVVEPLHDGTEVALRWPAIDADRFNMNVLDVWAATSTEEALDVCASWLGPPQNCMIADRHGDIAWTISGYLPERVGFDGAIPADWSSGEIGWAVGEQFERPRIVNPDSGFVATANGRTVAAGASAAHGANWGNPVRQRRIRDRLREMDSVDERAMLGLQLDTDVTMVFDSYRAAALEAAGAIDAPRGARARRLIEAWNGRADLGEPGMSILEAFRRALHKRVIDHLTAPTREAHDGFRYSWFQSDEVIRRIIEERPANLLPPGVDSWTGVYADAMERALVALKFVERTDEELAWGRVHRAQIRHPISMAVPQLGFLLDAPDDGLPGHTRAVRAQGPGFGASERLVVSPGRDEQGILHMPTGQVLHPLSDHRMDMHAAWVRGDATPLLAGETVATLRLVPAR